MENPVTLQGTIDRAGKLELNVPVPLEPGPVTVTIAPVADRPQQGSGWWAALQAARRELEGLGDPFLTEKKLAAHIEDLRSEDDRAEKAYDE